MKKLIGSIVILGALVLLTSFFFVKKSETQVEKSRFLNYEVNPLQQELHFYWKNENNINYKSFRELKSGLEKENKELVFAMNGGMYNKDLSPQGLYIENGETKARIDTAQNGYGNFYLQPNGIFYVTKENKPVICTTKMFTDSEHIKYATQSGPMLLIDGKIHAKFRKGSSNLHIRNGVGILPNGNLLFAISKEKTNFYDFASYFKQNGCKNALYLDGFVSRVYLPSKNQNQLDGNFGVIIGETKTK
ncbi:phosphodiester glycosidase family protein [Aquimarina megaterium]|uniref:phosphodiester glycosidase family protein n=1 Tax=Aquimarina megaterium TaxID=1443666 RepID=UPI0004706980|nr:phosphodiester glycosidase family protein [Aquimarina megaterium]